MLNYKVKGVEFTERAPPVNDIEKAQFAAQDSAKMLMTGLNSTVNYIKQKDD